MILQVGPRRDCVVFSKRLAPPKFSPRKMVRSREVAIIWPEFNSKLVVWGPVVWDARGIRK